MKLKTRSPVLLIALLITASATANAESLNFFSCFTRTISSLVSPSRQALRQASAEQLSALIAVDEETQKLVSNPRIAQYVYLNYFAEKTGQKDLAVALQDIVNSAETGQHDLYELVNNKLASRLQDPEVKAKVQAAFSGTDSGLRPGKIRSKLYTATANAKQALKFPTTVARLKKLIDEGFSQDAMDRGLFDFYGATQLGLSDSQLRPWTNISGGYSAIRPGQIENMSPDVWGQITRVASETEKPIHGYSTNSGDILRAAFPSLALFMGKTEEQALAWEIKAANLTKGEKTYGFCKNVWCREENRHEKAVGEIAGHVLGRDKNTPSTYEADPLGDFSNVDEALKHLAGRNSSEWNANSAYFFLLAHSKGAAHQAIDNVRADETKHMAIFSSAYKYVFGSQMNKRTGEMLEKIKRLTKEAKTANSSGSIIDDPAGKPSFFELAVAHLFVEKKTRDFNKTVPLKTMEKLFDSPVKTIKPIESVPVPAEKQKLIDEIAAREKDSRAKLARWLPNEREQYLALKQVEKEQGPLIESLIANLFGGFHGAEVVGSAGEKEVIKQISRLRTGLDSKTNSLIQKSLRETLRDYQIMNNSYVRSKPELAVRLKSAQEGFVVEPKAPGQAKVLLSETVNDSSHLIRVEKPANMTFKPGEAVRITVDTANGKEFRILSLASSPSKNYLEFAVRNSDSDFKKAFTALKPGKNVSLELAKGALNFKPDAPAVMIAGGIGITPFRSMIQFAKDEKMKNPMWLFYGNRDQIAFGHELNEAAAQSDQLKVTHVLSDGAPAWQGARGRVDDEFLKKVVPTLPGNAQYYIVGPPPMVTGAKDALTRLGIPEERISIEVFSGYNEARAPAQSAENKAADAVGNTASKDRTICFCHSVSEGQITSAIQKGATTLSLIQEKTKATTGCGGCECTVKDILRCQLQKLGK